MPGTTSPMISRAHGPTAGARTASPAFPTTNSVSVLRLPSGTGMTPSSRSGWPDNQSCLNILSWCWVKENERYLVVINFGQEASQAHVQVPCDELKGTTWSLNDVLSGESYERSGDEIRDAGLYVDLGRGNSICFVCCTILIREQSDDGTGSHLSSPTAEGAASRGSRKIQHTAPAPIMCACRQFSSTWAFLSCMFSANVLKVCSGISICSVTQEANAKPVPLVQGSDVDRYRIPFKSKIK